MTTTTWSAPVRYAEVDGQGIVFNAHYLVYCDEAMSLYCNDRGLAGMAERVQLKASSLTWSSSATYGEIVTVVPRCLHVGRTSFRITFDVQADGRLCCEVETLYVLIGADGRPAPLAEPDREALQS